MSSSYRGHFPQSLLPHHTEHISPIITPSSYRAHSPKHSSLIIQSTFPQSLLPHHTEHISPIITPSSYRAHFPNHYSLIIQSTFPQSLLPHHIEHISPIISICLHCAGDVRDLGCCIGPCPPPTCACLLFL